MTEPLNYADMVHLFEKVRVAMGESPAVMDEMFQTWGLEPEAVKETVINAVKSTVELEKLPFEADYAKAMVSSTVVGFIIGCMAMIEVETRKQTGEGEGENESTAL